MNKPFYILFFVFILNFFQYKSSFAQTNLIFNNDFEVYDTCPSGPSNPADFEINHCLGWYAPTDSGTSDYFNACNTTSVGVPVNFFGYQNAYSGNAYCGLFVYAIDFQGRQYREYIQSKLNQQLLAGKKYHLSFFVAFAGYSYAISKIGATFSTTPINRTDYQPLVATPQVINTSGFITDSVNWTKIEGTFFAQGGEDYITIGNFENSSTTDTLNVDPSIYQFGIVGDLSYYYVDGIELIEENINIPNVFTPNGDGINDDFNIGFPYETTSIFNRWGQKNFETTDNNTYWNGKTNTGKNVPDGTYYYIIKTKEITYKGFVQLIR